MEPTKSSRSDLERDSMLGPGRLPRRYARIFCRGIGGCVLLLTAACAQSSAPPPSTAASAPAAAQAAVAPPVLMEKAALCGRSVGVAVRCNMVTDQNDFAILRYMSLQGLQAQSGAAADFSQAEMAFDVAALEMMNSVGACQGNASALATLEQKIEATIAQCTKPQP
ncbi:MAG: hypothetical protein AB7S71_15480 [Dongiaceae bacterium]